MWLRGLPLITGFVISTDIIARRIWGQECVCFGNLGIASLRFADNVVRLASSDHVWNGLQPNEKRLGWVSVPPSLRLWSFAGKRKECFLRNGFHSQFLCNFLLNELENVKINKTIQPENLVNQDPMCSLSSVYLFISSGLGCLGIPQEELERCWKEGSLDYLA